MPEVLLVPLEGAKIIVQRAVAELSVLVKEMLVEGEGEETPEIPLPNVKEDVLKKVVEFCTHHVNDPMAEIEKPLKSNKMIEIVGAWDAEFAEIEQPLLFATILAANYLDIPSLLNLLCAKVATMIKEATSEEIRAKFNITNDLTPEEEAQMKEEAKWCEDIQ